MATDPARSEIDPYLSTSIRTIRVIRGCLFLPSEKSGEGTPSTPPKRLLIRPRQKESSLDRTDLGPHTQGLA